MAWSVQIGKLFGIPLKMHLTFPLLLLLIVMQPAGQSAQGGVVGGLLVLLLFACVVIHELSHSLVARHYGIVVREIILLPIGGVSMMERMPDDPRQEFNVAIAGPLASAGIAVVLGAGVYLFGGSAALAPPWHGVAGFVGLLAWMNGILAAFNLLPLFPADGGRVLRAFLATRMDYARATHAATVIGQSFAILLGLAGLLLHNYWWVLIAVFLFMGAASEDSHVRLRAALKGVPARKAMVSEFRSLDRDETLMEAFAHASRSYQHDFPVTDGGQLVGLVTRQALITGMHERGGEAIVGEVMSGGTCQIGPEDSLATLFEQIAGGTCPVAAVVDGGTLQGLVTPESISQYVMASALPPRPRA